MLKYYNEYINNEGVIFSIDKIVIDFKLSSLEQYDYINRKISSCIDLFYDSWISSKYGTYKYNYSFKCDDNISFWLGGFFNGNSSDTSENNKKIRIEFNPNKVFKTFAFKYVYNTIIEQAGKGVRIRRFDLAVDYHVLRKNVYLIKDRRKYTEIRNSFEDRTQYLGMHNNHGFVKVYNKTKESNLNYKLTRYEITIDYDKRGYNEFIKIAPTVKILNDLQLCFDGFKLNDTDRFIINSVLDNYDNVNLLSRRKKEKIDSILGKYSQSLKIKKIDYDYIISSLEQYFNKLEFEYDFNPFTLKNELIESF